MQTFLPYSSFYKSADSLDKKRCFKQTVEAKQILCTLRAPNLPETWKQMRSYQFQRWKRHPAVRMWKEYEEALKLYYNVFLETSLEKHNYNTSMKFLSVEKNKIIYPWWLPQQSLHKAMRARLIEKDPKFYGQIFKSSKDYNGNKYLWPNMETKEFYII